MSSATWEFQDGSQRTLEFEKSYREFYLWRLDGQEETSLGPRVHTGGSREWMLKRTGERWELPPDYWKR